MDALAHGSQHLAEGDLDQTVTAQLTGALVQICEDFNSWIGGPHSAMEPITNNAFAIDLGAEHSVRLQRTGERSERLVSRTKKMPRCLCGRETGECLSEIVVEGQDIDRKIGAAVDSAREQAAGLNEINETLINRNQGTQKNAAMVEESTAASHGLAREVSALNMLLATFKTGATRQEISSAPVVAAQATPPMSANRVKPQKVNRAFASQGNAAIAQSTDNWEEF